MGAVIAAPGTLAAGLFLGGGVALKEGSIAR